MAVLTPGVINPKSKKSTLCSSGMGGFLKVCQTFILPSDYNCPKLYSFSEDDIIKISACPTKAGFIYTERSSARQVFFSKNNPEMPITRGRYFSRKKSLQCSMLLQTGYTSDL